MTQSTFSAQVANNLLTLLQRYTKGIRFIALLTMLCTIGVGQMWGADYSIVFLTAASDGSTEIKNTTQTSTVLESSSCSYVKAFTANCSKAYYKGKSGVKLSSSKASGTLEFNLADICKQNVSKIVFKTVQYSNESSTLTFYAGSTSLGTTTSGTTFTHTFNSSQEVSTIKITSSKRSYISEIIISTSGNAGGSTPTQLSAPTGLTESNITSSGATLSWNAVANASSYIVTMVDGASLEQDYLVNGTTKTFDNLNPSTDYLWTVTAVGDGINYTNSEESVTGEFTTSAAGGGGGEGECSWVETVIGSIKSTDIVVITMTNNNGTYAMSNSNGTSSAPTATKVTVSGTKLTGTIADNLKWNISNSNGTLTIYPNETTSTWLYCTSSNNGVRVGINTNKTFTIDAISGYLKHSNTSRYLGVYNNADWRCYTSTTTNIANQTLKFYVYQCSDDGGDEPTPTQLTKPTNLKVSDVTTTTATLSWDAVANASGYTVVVGSTSHNTNTTSITVENLTASTTYKWSVTAKGNGSTYTDSNAANGSDFTTKTPAPTNYTITYVTNGGRKIDPMTEQTALPNPLPKTERDHYTFVGWYMDETFQTQATAGAEINANTTLYAKWTPVTYTVTFDAGSGACDTKSIQGNFEAGITLPDATPCDYASTNGWSFVGWSETTVSETTVRPAIHTGNYKPTDNITLHAVYAKTGTAQGGAGEFILSLQYEGTPYYVGQTFDNNKLSAETNQANAALFTIEDNYLHYEGGYISHVATTSSPNITKQADKANAKAWTITQEANIVIFTSTADNTRGLGFNYNNGSPRFAAYQLSNADYPHTFTKTSISGGNIQVTTYNSNPSCVAPVDPTWQPATINFEGIIQVECGSKTRLNAADPNGPATITFNGYDLQNSVTVTASEGFLVSTNKEEENTYKQEVIVNPHKDGNNIGKIQNVYVIAQAPAQSGDYDGTITLTGTDITGGSQTINVTANVECTQYTITWSVSGDETQKTTFYAGGDWELPENPTFNCNGRVFVGWTDNEIVQPQDIAPNVLYKEQGKFPTIESDRTFYAVFAQEGTGDGSGTATVTDVLNREWTEVSGTTYKDWNGKTATSSAVYAGNSAGGNESIQLRSDASKDAAGIITTTSGGKATNITVVWYDQTAAGRTLNVYGKKSAYSAVADLRSEDSRGTLLGTIVKGTSTSLTISNDYEYIGLCSNSGAMYLTSIAITWATDGEGDGNATTYTSYTTSCADVKAIRIVEPTTKIFNEGDKFVFDGKVWAINSDDSETDVTNSPLVHFDVDMNKVGTQTVTVSYLGFTATYEITINAVDKWQITWNVSGATSTGLSPATVVKGQAIGKLPNPKAIPNGCEGKTFVGWTESNTVNSDGTEITFITSSTVPTQNTTYYAVFAAPSGNAGDGDYVKVTEDANDLSGKYLIVYEEGNLAFNGGLTTLDAENNTIDVTIDGNTIKSTSTTDAAKFTITKNGDAYIITSARNYHIGQTSDANGLLSSTSTSYTNTITITDGNADIIGSGKAHLRYNSASNQNRFRYYKSTTYTSQQPIALYKKSGSSASYTDYTTGCHDVTITYYGFTGGYTTNCGGSDLNVITQRVNSSHTIPNCDNITDPTTLGRTFLNLWKDQNGKVHQPGESFIVTQDITLYAQWALNTSEENTTLPTDVEDLATTDIIVTGGTTLTIPKGETITINSLTLKGGIQADGSYKMPIINIPDNATLKRKSDIIYLDLVVNAKNYYPFAVPFRAKNGSDKANWDYVGYIDPVLKEAATYRTHFVIKTYDGAKRAENGENKDANWVIVNRDTYLEPGVGYIISALTYPDKETATIRIPMTVPNEWLANGEQESITVKEQTTTRNQVTVIAHTGPATDINNGGHQRHAGWNFVANPYLSMFAGTNASNEGGSFINGEILINKGDYSYGGDNVPYVTVPAYNFAYYEQFKLSEATLSPAYSFFVQVGTDGTMTFETTGRQQAPASIAARNAEERPVKMDVDITLSDNHSSDLTGIIISDRYNDTYEIGRDLEKLFGSAYNLSVYTLMADNTPLAYQALAIRSSMQVIPVGYRAPAQGEYTFRLNEATSSIDLLNEQYEQLVLVDYQTGALTNLLNSDYTFYSERTQSDNRFAIYAVPRQNASTDLPNAIGQDKEAQKIIHNGHLYILRNGNVYNGAGQIVK